MLLAWLAAAAVCVHARPAVRQRFSLSPPPGWRMIAHAPGTLLRLKGPENSAFALTPAPPVALDDRAEVSRFLSGTLSALDSRTGLDFRQAGPVRSVRYGLRSFLYIEATLRGRPRLILALGGDGRSPVLATLISSVPRLMMPDLLGGLRFSGAQPDATGLVRSEDGQLRLSLPAGVSARPLSAEESKRGFVLALRGRGSELLVLRLLEAEATPAAQEAAIMERTVLKESGVNTATLSRARRLSTRAGPGIIYASARLSAKGAGSFLAGFLPWGYWGYSILARGEDPEGLLRASFSALSLGPEAEPRVIAATPFIPLPAPSPLGRDGRLAAAAAGAILVAVVEVWALRPRRML
ncbi:MAG: hypothetical protein KGO96_06680 [Elusimicrobia bacterium]|nr:hypothetical protein [Elusimicrobiota bacterium]MDE2237828.1 hypothetical protein [Elusimicrobiota bacterium]MDE2425576.1 hypothetical protein [Elusimicrobiota bacterium]